jgi:hypothetical protein
MRHRSSADLQDIARGGYPEATPPQPHRRRQRFGDGFRAEGGPPHN